MPTAGGIHVGIVRAKTAAINVDRAIIPVAGALVGRPSHLIAEEGKVLVHLVQQVCLGRLSDVWIGSRSPGNGPPSVGHVSLGVVVLG